MAGEGEVGAGGRISHKVKQRKRVMRGRRGLGVCNTTCSSKGKGLKVGIRNVGRYLSLARKWKGGARGKGMTSDYTHIHEQAGTHTQVLFSVCMTG